VSNCEEGQKIIEVIEELEEVQPQKEDVQVLCFVCFGVK
jgi:hypothetical protein